MSSILNESNVSNNKNNIMVNSEITNNLITSSIPINSAINISNNASNILKITGSPASVADKNVSVISDKNSNAFIFQEMTINGNTETKFVKMTNGNISTEITPQDVSVIKNL
jgi:hypothetical protein